MASHRLSRRSFLTASGLTISGVASLALAAPAKKISTGLELYSVRDALAKDLMGTVRAVAGMGYEIVEFYAPYFEWTPAYAKQVRALMDGLGIRCNSTHNDTEAFTPEGLKKAVELNQILGSKYVVWAGGDEPQSLDSWKGTAAKLTAASQTLAASNLQAGYHNHGPDFTIVGGHRPIEILAANTPKEVMLQLDVGHCLEGGGDPVAWIRANPGRIRSLHIKDWKSGSGKHIQKRETEYGINTRLTKSPDGETGFRVLVGEGDVQWHRVIDAAESMGGVEFYLIEQEGSRFPELETAERCLANWKRVKAQI
jgi:sugar phosphate isomerase/epimerase